MTLGSGGPPKWFVAFCVFLGVGVGYVTAAIAMSFWSVTGGEENRGLFILIWMFAGVIFFAWPMHIVVRARAVRKQTQVLRERIGDLDYEPPTFPVFGSRAPGPTDEMQIEDREADAPKFRKFLARGRTAEQRMADHLASLELKAEAEKAMESKTEGQEGSAHSD